MSIVYIMERFSAGTLELYRMFSLSPPTNSDMNKIRIDFKEEYTDQQLIDFLNGEDVIELFHEGKLLAKDDN